MTDSWKMSRLHEACRVSPGWQPSTPWNPEPWGCSSCSPISLAHTTNTPPYIQPSWSCSQEAWRTPPNWRKPQIRRGAMESTRTWWKSTELTIDTWPKTGSLNCEAMPMTQQTAVMQRNPLKEKQEAQTVFFSLGQRRASLTWKKMAHF